MANTMSKYGSNTNRPLSEIVGLSTDTKPTDSIEGIQIQNGSSFRELDTGKRFLFDAENTTWNEVSSGGGGGGSTLIEKSTSANGVYNASDDNADGYSKVTVDVSNTYTAQDEGKVVSNGALVAQTTHAEITENGTYDITTNNSVSVNVSGGATIISNNVRAKPMSTNFHQKYFENKAWNGLTNFRGSYVWTDGVNIYISNNSNQYTLEKTTSTWNLKNWNGLTNFYGYNVWTNGNEIFYSEGNKQYILDKSTSTWTEKTWNGLTNFEGQYIWSDGENIYYSYGTTQYILDISNSQWTEKTWNGLTNFYGGELWSDGENIYYSNSNSHYILDKLTSNWSTKTWTGQTNFNGSHIWTDGENIYNGVNNRRLNKINSNWDAYELNVSVNGSTIWTDGVYIYSSYNTSQYVLRDDYEHNLTPFPFMKPILT